MGKSALCAILLMQLRHARGALEPPGPLSDARTHAARKSVKSARATLRVLRALIGRAAYRSANRALRDAAAPLGAARDAAALLQTLDRLSRHDHPPAAGTRTLRRRLERDAQRTHRRLGPASAARRAALVRLARVERQARGWAGGEERARSTGPSGLLRGVQRTYRHGRRSYAAVRRRATDAALHEWRKQSKYLAGELQLLRTMRPRRFDPPQRRAARIAALLGSDHDLALLRTELQHCGAPDALRPLLERIDRSRARLQARALSAGERLYHLRPAQFTAPLRPK
jgi:hypothetical protein